MSASVEDNAPDLTAKVAAAWREFTTALAAVLPRLPEGSDLALILDPTSSGTGNAIYDVSFSVDADRLVRADATSNATLPENAQLNRVAVGQLVALGWQPPGVLDGSGERFGLHVPADDAAQLATVVARTMRDVYGAPHPAFLTYDFQGPDDDADVDLSLTPARPLPSARVTIEQEPLAVVAAPAQSGPLADMVATVVAALLHTTPSHLSIDDAGEISVRSGSAMVFIKPSEAPPVVDVYSPLLTDVAGNERLWRELSELTRRLPIGRLYFSDSTIWASVPVYGRDFQPRHLMLAVESMTRLADDLDDRLQEKFGGRRFFDPKPLPSGATDEDDTPPMGLYL